MRAAQDEIRTVPHPRCLLCGSEGEVLYHDLVDSLFQAPGIWQLKQCVKASCGLIWLDPAPIEADLPLLYHKYFFSPGSRNGTASFTRRVRSFLYAVYKAAAYLPGILVGLPRAQERMRRVFLEDLPPGKLLDVGCGDGSFLHRMRLLGWSVDGMDFDVAAIESAKARYGLNLRHGDLAASRFPDSVFDAVTMHHVIEHVPDPLALLAEVRRVLKLGGRLVVVTPNSRSLGHSEFRSHWVNLDPPRHLHIFTPMALRECATRVGLRVERLFSSAANADSFIGASYGVREFYAERNRKATAPQIHIIRALRSLVFQCREAVRLQRNPDAGEEAVLICQR